MPKSSMAIWMLSAFNCRNVFSVCSFLSSKTDSVISSSSRSASRPLCSSASVTASIRPGLRNWTGDRLTAIFKGLVHLTASVQAVLSTQSPSELMKPIRSATGMNSIGDTAPRTGWFQRTSAS